MARSFSRHITVAVAAVLLLPGMSLSLAAPGRAHAQVALTVNSTADEPDASSDGVCSSTPSGMCTLRAALQEIDNGGTVMVPAGLYVLSIPAGTESSSLPAPASGDLDISNEVTIIGAGANSTVIDGNHDHRIFDIHAPGGFAHISRMGLRNGKADFDGATGHVHGGIIHNHGHLELNESTVSDGVSDAGTPWGGGGITNAGNGTASLRNVTVSRNSTTFHGGGIENGGALTLSYVTFSENSAPAGQGGGVASDVGFFTLNTGVATVGNTMLANNPGGNCEGPGAAFTSAGYNLQDSGSCPFLSTGDTVGAPLLSAVNNNFSSIFVYALQAGSPAVDTASPLNCPATDERGVTRPQEGDGIPPAFCDKGAYEFVAAATMCDGHPATIVGTAGNDTIAGTPGSDVIAGLGGNDKIRGLGGSDRICGGPGNDRLQGDAGNDRLFGQQGNDSLYGNDGNDVLHGGANTDRCVGGPGADTNIRCEH